MSKSEEEIETTIQKAIEKFGWFVAKFEATDYLPSFAYTIGLWKNFGHPELISFGLPLTVLHDILNIGGELVKAGETLTLAREYDDFFENSKAQLLAVDPANQSDYLGYAIWFNEGTFPTYQIVWPDRDNYWPWEVGDGEALNYPQPLLDRNTDFKFREEKNLGVITDWYFLQAGKPILYVEHDSAGEWLFLTGEECMSGDARLISLEQLIELDPSLNQLFNLDYGEFAERASVESPWQRGKL